MKYGLLTGFLKPFTNYGDYVQSMAIEYIYNLMGISEDEIYHITLEELAEYDGEQLLLPYNYYFSLIIDQHTGRVILSDKITPVFLGLTLSDGKFGHSIKDILSTESINYLRRYEPIGCRDEYSRIVLESYGVQAYLQGCLSNVLPKRQDGDYHKVMLINCPMEVLPFIPNDIISKAEAMENSGYIGDLNAEETWLKVKQHYEYIRDNASLVVSSRYHAVSPCYAMGIPSIFVKRVYDHLLEDVRLDTLNPFIPVYTYNNYSEIDWYPVHKENIYLKESLIELSIARINEVYKRNTRVEQISGFWFQSINRYNSRIKYTEDIHKLCLKEFVEKNYPYAKEGGFYIWGAKPIFCLKDRVTIVDYITEVNPELKFLGWIDTYKTGSLANQPIFSPDSFTLGSNDFVVIASETAITDAKMRLEQMGIEKERYIICVNQYITAHDIKGGCIR